MIAVRSPSAVLTKPTVAVDWSGTAMAEIFAGADALTRAKSDCPSGPSSEIFAVADTGSEAAMAMPVADFGTSPRSMADARFAFSSC